MNDLFRRLSDLWDFTPQGLINVIDVLLVAYVVYRLLKLMRGTRAWRVGIGVGMFVIALFVSDWLELRTLHWILDKATLLAPVALVILLLPELRQAVEGMGKIGLWPERFILGDPAMGSDVLEEVVQAVHEMSSQRIGALIVLERGNNLDDVAANGVPVKGQVSAPLIGAIFYHGNPLHDGAVIIRQDRLLAAACRLPLSENPGLSSQYHMRHRAGVGITEQSDCLVVIVSEERGAITVAQDGMLSQPLTMKELRDTLNSEMRGSWMERSRRKRRQQAAEPETPGAVGR